MVILRESCLVYLGINYINVPPVQSLFFCDSNCWEISVSSSRCASFFILFFPSVLLATLRPEVSHKPWVTLFFALLPRAARAATRWRRRPLEARRGAEPPRCHRDGRGAAARGGCGARAGRSPVPSLPSTGLCARILPLSVEGVVVARRGALGTLPAPCPSGACSLPPW